MKRRRYNPEQIASFLQQAELGISIADICRKHGFTQQTFYRWKKQYAGMGVAELREFKETKKENAQGNPHRTTARSFLETIWTGGPMKTAYSFILFAPESPLKMLT